MILAEKYKQKVEWEFMVTNRRNLRQHLIKLLLSWRILLDWTLQTVNSMLLQTVYSLLRWKTMDMCMPMC